MKSGSCLLVFGISGVGKTRACKEFVARNPNYLFVSASSLLMSAKRITSEHLRVASKDQIHRNQDSLASELARFRAGREERPILIDAHGVIDNGNAFVTIPTDTVRSLEPDGMILLEAPAATVATRRRSDQRTRPLRSELELISETEAERAAVLGYSQTMGLPIYIATVSDHFRLDAAVADVLRTVVARRPHP